MGFRGKIVDIQNSSGSYVVVTMDIETDKGFSIDSKKLMLLDTSEQFKTLNAIGINGKLKAEFTDEGMTYSKALYSPLLSDSDKIWTIFSKEDYNTVEVTKMEKLYENLDRTFSQLGDFDKEVIRSAITSVDAVTLVDMITLIVSGNEDWVKEIVNSN